MESVVLHLSPRPPPIWPLMLTLTPHPDSLLSNFDFTLTIWLKICISSFEKVNELDLPDCSFRKYYIFSAPTLPTLYQNDYV